MREISTKILLPLCFLSKIPFELVRAWLELCGKDDVTRVKNNALWVCVASMC